MTEKPNYINGYKKAQEKPLWKWEGIKGNKKKNKEKRVSMVDVMEDSARKIQEMVVGPGVGAGAGCGVGLGFGFTGGVGFGGTPVKMVFGVGLGCGVGLGFGYGQGIGFGSTLDSLKSRFFPPKSRKRVVIQI